MRQDWRRSHTSRRLPPNGQVARLGSDVAPSHRCDHHSSNKVTGLASLETATLPLDCGSNNTGQIECSLYNLSKLPTASEGLEGEPRLSDSEGARLDKLHRHLLRLARAIGLYFGEMIRMWPMTASRNACEYAIHRTPRSAYEFTCKSLRSRSC